MQEGLNAGARGFLLKSDAARDLVAALEALRRGKIYFTPKVASLVLNGYLRRDGAPAPSETRGRSRLTLREREVDQLLAEGKSSKEVAVALGLSVKTAETHRSNIMRIFCANSNCTLSATWFSMRCATTLCMSYNRRHERLRITSGDLAQLKRVPPDRM